MNETRQEQRTEARYRLVARPEEITHLVCCRDVSWRRTFCGEEGLEINPAAREVCAMCMEEAAAMRPDWLSGSELRCPVDGNPCPDEAEIDRRIAREIE
ncbi:hypothetical protein GCM10010174_75260 [Kutzneria viridogrisea]|uniref:Uncharacterized protein n=1 Tax=Kutzneria viridogrisea TaxID=47990 RepID=A0ABR6BNW4_9PSEU|nr:hypothetical protein [Kutzneria viridogrisea]